MRYISKHGRDKKKHRRRYARRVAKREYRTAFFGWRDTPPTWEDRKASYRRYLNSQVWQRSKARFRKTLRHTGHCAECGATERLDVHHLTYARIGKEKPEDLIELCRACHKAAHQALNPTYCRWIDAPAGTQEPRPWRVSHNRKAADRDTRPRIVGDSPACRVVKPAGVPGREK